VQLKAPDLPVPVDLIAVDNSIVASRPLSRWQPSLAHHPDDAPVIDGLEIKDADAG
jgi:hypothetical protein